jgi:OPA family glycerol-3-phosphate transporter-like MFS transporter
LNVYAAGENERAGTETAAKPGLLEILRPLLASRFFWLVCLLSLGTTLLRETFNLWTPTYFVEFVGLSNADAASKSALFPLFGGVSVLLAGFLSDRLGLNGRSLVLFGGLVSGTCCLFLLGRVSPHGNPWLPVALVALVGFLLLGPYSYLAGAMSMDFGGEKGSATAAGIIDGVGYLAGVMSGDTMARVTVQYGWRNAFLGLAAVCLLTAAVALVLAVSQRREAKLRAQASA